MAGGKRLPRRTMSMSKRAGKLAEDASAVVKGTTKGKKRAQRRAVTAKPTPRQYHIGAWLGMLALIVASVALARILFTVGVGDTDVTGALPHGEPTSMIPALRQSLEEVTPEADAFQGVDPFCVPTEVFAYLAPEVFEGIAPPCDNTGVTVIVVEQGGEPARVGGTNVPAGLTCQEDEAIGFKGQALVCIHREGNTLEP